MILADGSGSGDWGGRGGWGGGSGGDGYGSSGEVIVGTRKMSATIEIRQTEPIAGLTKQRLWRTKP